MCQEPIFCFFGLDCGRTAESRLNWRIARPHDFVAHRTATIHSAAANRESHFF